MGKVIKMPLQSERRETTAAATHDDVQNRESLNTSHRNGSSRTKQHCMHVCEYYSHLCQDSADLRMLKRRVFLAWHERKKAEGF